MNKRTHNIIKYENISIFQYIKALVYIVTLTVILTFSGNIYPENPETGKGISVVYAEGEDDSSGYSEEQKAAAKAWLSAHGYAPTRAGAAQAYQDYLNGNLDNDPDVRRYKGLDTEDSSADETSDSSAEGNGSEGEGSETGAEGADEDKKWDADEEAAQNGDTVKSDGNSDKSASSDENGSEGDFGTIFALMEDGDAELMNSVDIKAANFQERFTVYGDRLKLSERTDKNIFLVYIEEEEVQPITTESSGNTFVGIIIVMIVLMLVALVMFVVTSRRRHS